MKYLFLIVVSLMIGFVSSAYAKGDFERDTIVTSSGNLEVTFIGHGSLMFSWGGKVVQVDPYGKLADYSLFPKADVVFITHDHGDHLDLDALSSIRSNKTALVLNEAAAAKVGGGTVLKNGDIQTVAGFEVEAVSAYNLVHMRSEGMPFHPKGVGNGYIIAFGDKRVYVAGDTENTPEMKNLKDIDIAFLPMNLPYTMTPEMAADAARSLRPGILYPYHYGSTDTKKIVDLLKDDTSIEVRIRRMM